jgi:hypothetical protein
MTETSKFWGGEITGDCGPYTYDDWADFFAKIFAIDTAYCGPIVGYENELEVTDAGGLNVQIDTGAALVNGRFYENDAAVVDAAANNEWSLVLLRNDYAAQETRAIVRSNSYASEAAALASIVQNATYWDIPLATVLTSAGAISSINDKRRFTRIPALVGARARQGFRYDGWQYAGINNFILSGMAEQFGTTLLTIGATTQRIKSVTFPRPFLEKPIIYLCQASNGGSIVLDFQFMSYNISLTGFDILFHRPTSATTGTLKFFWRAVGRL